MKYSTFVFELIERLSNKIRHISRNLLRRRTTNCKTKYGFKLILNLRNDVDLRFLEGNFEDNTIKLFLETLKEGMTVVDVGANIGIYSLIGATIVKSVGQVYSFEPAERAYHRLLDNIKINNFTNIKAMKIGVSDHSGETILNICKDDAYNSIGDAPMRNIISQERIEVVSLDDFAIIENVRKIDVIKIDTEGAELLVLRGAEKILKNDHPTIFFEYNPFAGKGFDFDPKESLRYLQQFGYKFYEFDNTELTEIHNLNITTNDIVAM